MVYFNYILYTNTFQYYQDTCMQNSDKALPRFFFVVKPSHHFAYQCLDVKIYYRELAFVGNFFSEWLCWITQFGYLNIVFNLNTWSFILIFKHSTQVVHITASWYCIFVVFFYPEVQSAWYMLIFISDRLSVVFAEFTELIWLFEMECLI